MSETTNHLNPVFRQSTFQKRDVLISESFDRIPLARLIMVLTCIIIGVITLVNLLMTYKKYRSELRQTVFHRIFVPTALIINIILHVAHYAHNIYDPAAYFEPKRLYVKIFFTEMEQTFLFNFPLSIVFIIATRKLLSSCTNQSGRSLSMLWIVGLYTLMSMVSGGHYRYEPPSNFSFQCNMTIAGETTVAFALFIVAIIVFRSNSTQSKDYQYRQLAGGAESNVYVPMTDYSQRHFKSKSSDADSN